MRATTTIDCESNFTQFEFAMNFHSFLVDSIPVAVEAVPAMNVNGFRKRKTFIVSDKVKHDIQFSSRTNCTQSDNLFLFVLLLYAEKKRLKLIEFDFSCSFSAPLDM